jgi:hypothetical protein
MNGRAQEVEKLALKILAAPGYKTDRDKALEDKDRVLGLGR